MPPRDAVAPLCETFFRPFIREPTVVMPLGNRVIKRAKGIVGLVAASEQVQIGVASDPAD